MNEIQLVLLGLIVLGSSLLFFYLTDVVPPNIENTEMSIIISLGIGLLILIVDKRQGRNIDELIKTQHELTNEIHKMIKEFCSNNVCATVVDDAIRFVSQKSREKLKSSSINNEKNQMSLIMMNMKISVKKKSQKRRPAE
jgi:hypothetical protein